jgi:gentisate 1,2-dioxygenase
MDPDTYFKSMVPSDTRPGVWRWDDIQHVLDEMDNHPKRYPAYRRFCALVNSDFDGVPGASPAIFMGVQRIHPGEHVTPHRHNSVALYYWIQGSGRRSWATRRSASRRATSSPVRPGTRTSSSTMATRT